MKQMFPLQADASDKVAARNFRKVDAMNKIRTTHAGSLPRPTELTALYAARAKGETVDEAGITRLGQQSAERLINRQVEIGMDIVNDGEQMRESFFFYVRVRRHRVAQLLA
jgi:methionine synthase II (cobalamin-independent)